MKPNPFKSLGAKLSYLTTGLILLTLAGSTWNYNRLFRQFMLKQTEAELRLRAKESAERIGKTIDDWGDKLGKFVPELSSLAQAEAEEKMAGFLSANKEFVFLQIIKQDKNNAKKSGYFAVTTATDDPRFEENKLDEISGKIKSFNKRWLATKQAKASNSGATILVNATKKAKLPSPMLNIAKKFTIKNSEDVIWAILTCWPTELLASIPEGKNLSLSGKILDAKGNIFFSPLVLDKVGSSLRQLPIVAEALASNSSDGFKNEFPDKMAKTSFGAFQKLPKQNGLIVIIQKNKEELNLTTKEIFNKTVLWASLAFLFVILLSALMGNALSRRIKEITAVVHRIAYNNLSVSCDPRSGDELGFLALSINNLVQRISILIRQNIETAKLEKEAEAARMAQLGCTERKEMENVPFSLTSYYRPASGSGGDLWGHFQTKRGIQYLYIADSISRGGSAAFITAIAHSAFRTIAEYQKVGEAEDISPARLLDIVNRIIFGTIGGSKTLSCFVMSIDPQKGVLTFANAGHVAPLVLAANAEDQRFHRQSEQIEISQLNNKKFFKLIGDDTPLGISDGVIYSNASFNLLSTDKVVMFSRGMVDEIEKEDGGVVWNLDILLNHLTQAATKSIKDIRETIVAEVTPHLEGNKFVDDLTLLVFEPTISDTLTNLTPPPPLELPMEDEGLHKKVGLQKTA